jgi:hypothetical protein
MRRALSCKPSSRRGRHPWRALGLLTCAVTIAACGSSGSSSATPSHGLPPSNPGVRLADCMRAHRVPGFPDPSSTNEATLRLALSSGVDPQAPAFTHAAAVCGAPGLWDRVGLRVAG